MSRGKTNSKMNKKHIHLSVGIDNENSTNRMSSIYEDYTVNWKNIIFLPFNNLWRLFITFTVVLNSIFVIYDITYKDKTMFKNFLDVVYYTTALVYIFDTALSIAHRYK